MKKIITFVLIAANIFMTSCSKDTPLMKGNYKSTVITVTMQHDADNSPINWAFNCYPSDVKDQYDSDFVYNTMTPDTFHLKAYQRMNFSFPTGKTDSSFSTVVLRDGSILNLPEPVIMLGPIMHRDYTFVAKIKSIKYGSMQ